MKYIIYISLVFFAFSLNSCKKVTPIQKAKTESVSNISIEKSSLNSHITDPENEEDKKPITDPENEEDKKID